MSIIQPGTGLLFMKVGVHAKEDLDSILKRKRDEIERGGFAMWGYGGNTCHPLTMVRPFVESYQKPGSPILLVMEEIESKHFAEQIAADEYSVNGQDWISIDTTIHRVLGSRYALFINNLREVDDKLLLSHSKVAVGPKEGRGGDAYIQGRVDKACLITQPTHTEVAEDVYRPIKLVADIIAPYAALLRNKV